MSWIRGKQFCIHGVSVFWRGFILTLPWLGRSLSWQVGDGENVQFGIDPIIGILDSFTWPVGFREFLEDLDIVTLSQALNIILGSQYWYSTEDLCVIREWKLAWDSFTRNLELGGIRLHSRSDSLMWDFNKFDGTVSAKLVYESIVANSSSPTGCRVLKHIWSGTLPRKISCFIWLALTNKLLT